MGGPGAGGAGCGAGCQALLLDEAHRQGCPEPVFEETGFFTAIFRPNPEVRANAEAQASDQIGAKSAPSRHQVTGEVTDEVTGEVTGEVLRLLEAIQAGPLSRSEAQATLGLVGQANFRDRYLAPALKAGVIAMTIPDKARSSKQRYRITPRGLDFLNKNGEKN